jgi:hypothetical protein
MAMALRPPAEVLSDDALVQLLRLHVTDDAEPMVPDRATVLAALAG